MFWISVVAAALSAALVKLGFATAMVGVLSVALKTSVGIAISICAIIVLLAIKRRN